MISRPFRALVLALLTLTAAPVQAADAPLFTARGIQVDVTAETATQARQQALLEGQRKALRQLLETLTLRVDHDQLPLPGPEEAVTYVQDFTVTEEKRSSVRYIATLTVRFKPDAVRDLLRQAGVPYAADRSPPVLVLPVWQASPSATPVLWEEGNPWRAVWTNLPLDAGLVPMRVPLGDLNDMRAIDGRRAAAAQAAALEAIGQAHGLDNVMVAHAVGGRGTPPSLDVRVTRIGPRGGPRTFNRSFEGAAGEPRAALLTRAAEGLTATMEANWKRDHLIQVGETRRTTALAALNGLADWLTLRQRLTKTGMIQRVDLQALTRTQAQVALFHAGDEQQLVTALDQRDVTLRWSDGIYRLTLADGGPRR